MTIAQEDRATLLRLARQSVAAAVSRTRRPAPPRPEGVIGEVRGCFVTLTNRGQLRGCIGTFHPTLPLGEQVIEMAAAAARDPRFVFDPIRPDELKQLTLQVSVLSPLELIANPLDIELGVHGIYVIAGGAAAGCFLPEVAEETGWSKEQFLSHCCSGKAGLHAEAWRDGTAKVYTFTSEKFSEAGPEA